MTFTILLAAFGLVATPVPAQGTAVPITETAQRAELVIPFEPPLGETLRYRNTRTDTRGGNARSRSTDMQIRFARDGDNYTMTVEYVIPAELASTDPSALLMRRPLVLSVSADGEVLGLADDEAYWAALQDAIRATVRQATDVPEARARMEAFLTRLRALPVDERFALITEDFLPVVIAAGALLPLDEEIEHSDRRETAMGPLTQQSRMRIERVDADRVQLTTVMTVPTDEVERGMTGLFRELMPEMAGQQLRATSFEDHTVQLVSLVTGLTERWEMRRVVGMEAGGVETRVEQVRTLERVP